MIRSTLLTLVLVFAAFAPAVRAQREILPPETPLQQLALALRKIGKEGRLLEVTAHPDDEDNALLAYFGHGKGYRCTLLTLTRGEGGQNEIGPELDEDLAVLRMAELREAHRYDGAEQRFSRAIDFGYSFSEEETFEKWGREEILKDLVQVVREVRPHVILTMPFKAEGGGRHHQGSAILAREAFDVAATDRWPELGSPWAADRIFEQVWYAGGAASKPVDFVELFDVPVQDYDPVLGAIYAEIGFKARSMHRCQGTPRFEDPKAPPRRSRWRLAAWRGDKPAPEAGLFGGLAVESPTLRAPAVDPTNPDLVRAELIKLLPPDASTPIDPALETALALSWPLEIEARASWPFVRSGGNLDISVRIRNSSSEPTDSVGAMIVTDPIRKALQVPPLAAGAAHAESVRLEVPASASAWTAAQLTRLAGISRYREPSRGIPPRSFVRIAVTQTIAGRLIRREPVDVLHAPERDLGRPERQQVARSEAAARQVFLLPDSAPTADAAYRPRASLSFEKLGPPRLVGTALLPADQVNILCGPVFTVLSREAEPPLSIPIGIRHSSDAMKRELETLLPHQMTKVLTATWTSGSDVSRDTVGGYPWTAQQVVTTRAPFEWQPSFRTKVRFSWPTNETLSALEVRSIDYPHIGVAHRVRFADAEVQLVESAAPTKQRVLLLDGPARDLGQVLARVPGILLEQADPGDDDERLTKALQRADVVVLGTRATGSLAGMNSASFDMRGHPSLSLFLQGGGHVLVLYQKPEDFNHGEKSDQPSRWAPYPAKVGRNRTTDENGPVTVKVPDHPFFNQPNRITEADWKGWIQDRGLYYLETSDDRYQDLLTLEDPFAANAGAKGGALVTAQVGRGRWTYVGLALTRQLRAGVPGAWRLLVNLLSG